ncbi:MAG TPA: hypothetical protein VFE24_00805 [Pirellulales bacterium]|jgi:hypothetical protein|nr:hypothetical protein [Pirellulales bacterium]
MNELRKLLADHTLPVWRRCELFLERLAAPSGPIYFVMPNQIGDAHLFCNGVGTAVGGYAYPSLDRLLRPPLERAKRWRGPGLAMIVANQVAGQRTSLERRLLTGIHELAHLILFLPQPWLPDRGHSAAAPAAARQQSAISVISASLDRYARDGAISREAPYALHEFDFIRVALHGLMRAQKLGFQTGDERLVCAGEIYGLSPQENYVAAFGAEFERLAEVPLVGLSLEEPSAAAVDLWLADVRAWKQKQRSDEP